MFLGGPRDNFVFRGEWRVRGLFSGILLCELNKFELSRERGPDPPL